MNQREVKMVRKYTEELIILQDAITQIKKIKTEIQVKNQRLNKELDLAEHRLLDEYFQKTNQGSIKKKPIS